MKLASGLPRSHAGRDSRGAVADGDGAAEKEIGVLRQPQGERVGRVIDEYRLPVRDRLRRPAFRPGVGGGEMAPLALRGAAHRRFRRAQRLDHFRMIAAKAANHIEGSDRGAAEREIRIARERLLENPDWIAGQPVIVGDRPIERRRRTRARRQA